MTRPAVGWVVMTGHGRRR